MKSMDDMEYYDPVDIRENHDMGIIIAVFHFLFFIPLIFDAKRDSDYLKLRANYSLMICLADVVSTVLLNLEGFGVMNAVSIIFGIVNVIVRITWIAHIIFALKDRTDPMPVIGKIRIIK